MRTLCQLLSLIVLLQIADSGKAGPAEATGRESGDTVMGEMMWRPEWLAEGVRLLQVTSRPGIHMNLYCEVPYMDPAGRRLIYTRQEQGGAPTEIWCADLEDLSATRICSDSSVTGAAVSPDQRHFYFLSGPGGDALRLVRLDLETLEQKTYEFRGAPMPQTLGSVTPDGRYYVYGMHLPTDAGRFGIQRLDLTTGAAEMIHRGTEICNSHPQIEPRHGRDCLIQHNRGCEFDERGRITRLVGEEGATIYLINLEGGDVRPLPVGKPFTKPLQGHQCWLGRTGEVLLTVGGGPREESAKAGNLLRVRPGAERAEVVASGHYFCHVNASRCGRHFVCDTYPDAKILIGSIRTGRTRLLCESGASFGSKGYTHPHPYLSPDCKWVIFNSDRTGTPHVFAARVPDGWLDELARE